MAAIDPEAVDQLNDLKAVNGLLTSSLESDLVLLQAKYKATADELEQKSSHLVEKILANDKLTTINDEQGPTDETGQISSGNKMVKQTLETLKEVHTAATSISLLKQIGFWISLPRSFVQLTKFS